MTASVQQSRMTDRSQARKLLEEELRARMADLGFSGKKTDFNQKFTDETTLWVSLQILKDGETLLGLFPRVGFINWKVAEFFRRYLEDPINPAGNITPTLSATLGYLMCEPHQVECYFECTEASIRDAVKAVIQNMVSYGMSFMTRYPDLHSLHAWAKDPGVEPEATHFQPQLLRAVILYLVGDWIQAKDMIETQIAEAGEDLNDPSYGPIVRLRDLLSESPQGRLNH